MAIQRAIYEPMAAKGYEWINAVHDADFETFRQLDGEPRAATWKPIEVRRVRADPRHDFIASDFPWLGAHALVMRRSAVDALRDILVENGELLPLATRDDVELFVFNAQVTDALDEANASLIKFPGTDQIMLIRRVAFLAAKIRDRDVFRLPHRSTPTYVSERFIHRVTAAGLRGLTFEKIWEG